MIESAETNGLDSRAAMERLAALPRMPPAERRAALLDLVRATSPGVRGEALRVGAVMLADDVVEDLLREDADAVLRNAGLEMLKMRGARGFSLAVRLLGDEDDDVVLQAVLVLAYLKDPRALEPLRRLFRHRDPNVVQATVTAVGKIGDARVVEDLLPFLEGDLWLQFAAIEALGDLRAAAAAPALAELLTDVMVGFQAAEGLARIGGPEAWEALSRHWLELGEELDAGPFLGLLAHVAEGLRSAPAVPEALRASLAAALDAEEPDGRHAAARCTLALGPSSHDARALDLLAAAPAADAPLPTCLAGRPDLVFHLLAAGGVQGAWGFLLAARHPAGAPLDLLVDAARGLDSPDLVAAVATALGARGGAEALAAALEIYLALAPAFRGPLATLLARHPEELAAALESRPEIPEESRVVLRALAGADPGEVATAVTDLDPDRRLRVIFELADRRKVMRSLPWSRWLAEDAARYAAAVAEVAVRAGLRELLPELREVLQRVPSLEVIRAVGDLGDRESAPILIDLLRRGGAHQLVLVESLGRIGGREARQALRSILHDRDGDLVRIAYRALSYCAVAEDDDVFRAAARHPDWYVRLSCADVLGRFQRPENRATLAQLAADPVAIVSQRALSGLEG